MLRTLCTFISRISSNRGHNKVSTCSQYLRAQSESDLVRGLTARREKPDGGVATSAGRSGCERGVWKQECRLQADKWDQGQQFTSGEPMDPGRLVQDQDLKTSGASRTRTQRPVQGRNVPLGCDVAEPEDDVDAEENSNGIVTVNEVRLQVFLWFRI